MAHTIEESGEGHLRKLTLVVDGVVAATVSAPNGFVQLNWLVYGPQYWPKAVNIINGLFDLGVAADQFVGAKHGHDQN